MKARKQKPPRTRWQHWRRRLLWTLVGILAMPWLAVAALKVIDPPTSAFMLAYQWERAAGDPPLRQRWVALAEVAPDLQLAVIAAEDQLFGTHSGFDLDAIRSALGDERGRGASTISQQVAKNRFLWSGRSWLRKALEAGFTVCIETLWSKQRILEVYLNVAEFGHGIYGAEAAARHYFDKPAAALSRREAATLAAVLPSPKRWSVSVPGPHVVQRAGWIEQQMRQLGGTAALSTMLAGTKESEGP